MSQQMGSNKDFWDEVQFELLVVFGWLALGGLLFLRWHSSRAKRAEARAWLLQACFWFYLSLSMQF
jgi:hypothetical protein